MPVVTPREIARLRLVAQGLVGERPDDPAAVVHRMGAMQGQDLPGVMTSVALRTPGRDPAARRAAVVDAMNAGALVRSWPMRGTLHLLAAEDLGAILSLTADRMLRSTARNRERFGIDGAVLDRARAAALGALHAGGSLSRAELMALWAEAGLLGGDSGRGYRLLLTLAVSGDLCFGPFEGGQQRIVSAADWIAAPRTPDPEEALDGLVLRYFRSHGPATERDFAWWTKLPLRDIRAALARVRGCLEAVTVDGAEYLMAPDLRARAGGSGRASGVLLLPGFDEFLLGYGDRSAALPGEHAQKVVPGNNGMFRGTVVANGRVVGTWKRRGGGRNRRIDAEPFTAFPASVESVLDRRFAALP